MAAKKPNGTLSAEDARAQAALQMQDFIQSVEAAEKRHVGTWYEIPDGYDTWNFVRCGLRNADNARALSGQLRRMGYQPAPAGVRCAGYESDGSDGLYMCIPNDMWLTLRDRKNEARRTADEIIRSDMSARMGALKHSLGPGSDMRITRGTVEGSEGDILETIRSGKLD